MPKLSDDQIATLICSSLAITTVVLSIWLVNRRIFWPLLLTIPFLAFLGVAIYYFAFFRFTRLF